MGTPLSNKLNLNHSIKGRFTLLCLLGSLPITQAFQAEGLESTWEEHGDEKFKNLEKLYQHRKNKKTKHVFLKRVDKDDSSKTLEDEKTLPDLPDSELEKQMLKQKQGPRMRRSRNSRKASQFKRIDFFAQPEKEINDRSYPRLDIEIEELNIPQSKKQSRRNKKFTQNAYRLKPRMEDWVATTEREVVDLRKKGYRFMPNFKFTERYEDNIFNTGSNRIPDYVSELNLGFKLNMKSKHSLKLNYDMKPTIFAQREDENFLAHNAGLQFDMNTSTPLVLKFNDEWSFSGSPRSEERQIRSIFSDHKFGMGAVYNFSGAKTSLELNLNYKQLAYKEKIHFNLNKDTLSFDGKVNKSLGPKIDSSAFMKRTRDDFIKSPDITRDADNHRDEIGALAKYRLNEQWTFDVSSGYQKVKFKNTLDEDSNPRNNNDLFFIESAATFKWAKIYQAKFEWKRTVEQNLNKVSLGLNKTFYKTWEFSSNLSYAINDQKAIDTPARKDKNWNFDSALKYRLKKEMIFEFGYKLINTNSSVASRRELSNTLLFSFTFSPN